MIFSMFIDLCNRHQNQGFPDSSVGKESACNAGDPSSIPGSRRSAGEGIDLPLQYSWTFLGAQLVKNLPAMLETWVRSLGWEDLLEKGKATHLQYSGLENSMDLYSPWGHKELDTTEWLSLSPKSTWKLCRHYKKNIPSPFPSGP